MNSVSPGTAAKQPAFQSALACSMRSCELETKFHQICRGPSSGSPCDTASFWFRATTLRRNDDGIVRSVVASWREIVCATLLYLWVLLSAFVFQKNFTFAKKGGLFMNGILCYLSQVGDLLTRGVAPKALTSAFGWAVVRRGRCGASG